MEIEQGAASQPNDVVTELLARAQAGRDEMLRSMELMREMQAASTRDALGLMDHARGTLDEARTVSTESAGGGLRASPRLADARIDTLERSIAIVSERLTLAQQAVEAAVADATSVLRSHIPLPDGDDAE